jgi:hypothetical protein
MGIIITMMNHLWLTLSSTYINQLCVAHLGFYIISMSMFIEDKTMKMQHGTFLFPSSR